MNIILVGFIFGFLGAMLRVLTSFLDFSRTDKRKRLAFAGFSLYAIVVLSTGAFSGIIFGGGKSLSFLAGYAGMDFIDNYAKAFKNKKLKL